MTACYDIAIIGSGFAGSLLAAIARRLGRSVLLIDTSRHPRFAIGESSTPIGNMVLRKLCRQYDLHQLEPLSRWGTWQQHYPEIVGGPKRGFSYFQHRPGEPFTATETHSTELLVAANANLEVADTHWLRADVDGLFYRVARELGAEAKEQTRVVDLTRTDHWQLTLQGPKGQEQARARFLADASGAGEFLAGVLGLHDLSSQLKTRSRAVYTHLVDLPTWETFLHETGISTDHHPFPCDQAAMHHVLPHGWIWALRFADGRVSCGLVEVLDRSGPMADDPQIHWQKTMESFPSLRHWLSTARPAPQPGRWLACPRLQRLRQPAAGAHWALLPHAAGAIDPLHSTGIAHTMCSLHHLATILQHHWQRPSWETELAHYARRLRQEFQLIDRLVWACYLALPHFPLWVSATMLYFAAATHWEGQFDPHAASLPAYLGAEDPRWVQIVTSVCRQLQQWQASPQTPALQQFQQDLARQIAPYNHVGLCDPAAANMYRYTAAPDR